MHGKESRGSGKYVIMAPKNTLLDPKRHHVIDLPSIPNQGNVGTQLHRVSVVDEVIPVLSKIPPNPGQAFLTDNSNSADIGVDNDNMMDDPDEVILEMADSGRDDDMVNDTEQWGAEVPNSLPVC